MKQQTQAVLYSFRLLTAEREIKPNVMYEWSLVLNPNVRSPWKLSGLIIVNPEAEFKEFDPRLKFKSRLKNGWFHLKLY